MIECKYYTKDENLLKCNLCPHNCTISENKTGICKVRINNKGILKSLNYSNMTAVSLDHVEKKPLYHFYPGDMTLSVGSFGCNLSCKHCQNYDIATTNFAKYDHFEVFPEMLSFLAESKQTKLVSYTYNEPTVFYEFVLESAKNLKEKGFKNILVTNGFINNEPLLELIPFVDAANIDLKSFTDKFYIDVCGAKLNPVLETIKTFVQHKVHVELTYLVIPGLNDSDEEISNACKWIVENIGDEIPIHFTRFFPYYQMTDRQATPVSTLEKAFHIAKNAGIKYCYIGNVETEFQNTICPSCGKVLIERQNYNIKINFKEGQCSCGKKIYGNF
ncbi:AmmeMemoRadiSam system radical SAM enzyme [Candidatus Woesearchaeota archaeon]|nr:AmmeMemoRadiSam system radical SAM enzyme [Candidatus Woesearchaeota archaeon]